MKLSLLISSFLVLAAVLTCTAANDLAALKTTLQKLCDANKNRLYRSCCTSNNNGQDITSISSLPSCFGSLTASGDTITKLFVPNSMCPFGCIFLEFSSDILNKGLAAIPSGTFSGLTSLTSLRPVCGARLTGSC